MSSHLTFEVLVAKQRGKLSATQKETIAQHLDTCQHCQERYEIVSHLEKLPKVKRQNHAPPDKAGECLDETTIRLYVKGRLYFFRKRKVETHLSNCEVCRRVLISIVRAEASVAELEQISEEERALLQSFPRILPAERFAQVLARLRQPESQPVRRRIRSESWREKFAVVFDFSERPALAAAIVGVFVVGLFFGWNKATQWRSNVWAQRGTEWLAQKQRLTESDLRPSGDFKLGRFSRSRHRGQAITEENPADDYFRNSLRWNSRNRQARHGLALSAYFVGEHAYADSLLRLLVSENAQDARVWNDLAVVKYNRREVESVIEFLQKALQIQPNFAEAAFNLAAILEESGRIDEARRAWLNYVLIDSTSAWAGVAKKHLQYPSPP